MDTDTFLAAHARRLRHCPRMHLTALRLPCGEREECVAGSRCPVIAGEEPELPKPENAPSHGAAVLRKAVVDSGLTLKAFCQQHRICMNTMGQHMRGDIRISPLHAAPVRDQAGYSPQGAGRRHGPECAGHPPHAQKTVLVTCDPAPDRPRLLAQH